MSSDAQLYEIILNTYKAQKEDFFSYDAGRQMGYGQGFITETAILLDECEDIKGLIEQSRSIMLPSHQPQLHRPRGRVTTIRQAASGTEAPTLATACSRPKS